MGDFSEPVEVSLAVDNLGNAICGKLRAGDIINITINTKTSNGINTSKKIYTDVVVIGAYDSSCVAINAGDNKTNTAYITFYVEKGSEQELNDVLVYASSIRVSRNTR